MKNSEHPNLNPEPRLLWHAQGYWVAPWDYPGGTDLNYNASSHEQDGLLTLLGYLFCWLPPLSYFLLWKADAKGRKREEQRRRELRRERLERAGYRTTGPDTTRYGLWQMHPTTKRWVLTHSL